MIIDKDGYTLDTLDDLLTAFELFLKSKYGEDFYIKAEGVIDNIVTFTFDNGTVRNTEWDIRGSILYIRCQDEQFSMLISIIWQIKK